MANYSSLKSAVTSVIKTNGNKEITGAVLQSTLLAIINSLGDGFLFKGVATPSTNPGTPDQNVFYIGGAGTYTNFSGLVVPTGNLGVLKYNGVWAVSTVQVGAVPVNDLTTGGTTVPLSAEMGKTLKTYHDDNATAIQTVDEQISQLEAKVDEVVKESGNLFLMKGFYGVTGLSVVGNEVTGKATAFHSAFGGYNYVHNSYTKPFAENTQYTISCKVYTDGESGTTGQGLHVRIVYTDNTVYVATSAQNSVSEYTLIKATSLSGKTIAGIGFSYGSFPQNTWHIKDLQLEIGTIATEYEPPYLTEDYELRKIAVIGDEKLGIGIVNGYKFIGNTSGQFAPLYSINSYFPLESFQTAIRNTPLYGIRCLVKTIGTFTIVKATGVLTDNCVVSNIKTFNITKSGWNVLLFDSPLTIGDNESIGVGVSSDSAVLTIDTTSNDNSLKVYYLHYTLNTWQLFAQNVLIDILGIPKNESVVANEIQDIKKTNAFAGQNPFRFKGPYWAHLFTDKIYQESTDIVIPSESLDDIRISRRLGFDVIEANVHKTSDNKYVVIHGASGKFGYEVTDLNGDFTYADTAINSVTLDWIKSNIRYRSELARYRTTLPTFEEFLCECRLQGMIPLAQASEAGMVSLLDGIMGHNNYIAYNGTRALTTAPITDYKSLQTKEEILAHARTIGVPYIYSMANPNNFTETEIKEIVSALHSEGFMIATAYVSGDSANKYRRLGFDMIASTYEVNDFDNANICSLSSGFSWDDFQITGATPTTDVLTLQGAAQRIAPSQTYPSAFLAKAQLQIVFSGTLYIVMGQLGQIITSDGKHPLVLSSYFINSAPGFIVYGQNDGATITDIVFKASKC